MMTVTVKDVMDGRMKAGITQWSVPTPSCLLPSINRVFIYHRRADGAGTGKVLPRAVVIVPPAALDGSGYLVGRSCRSPDAFEQTACIAVSEAQGIPDSFLQFSKATGTAVFSSHYDEFLLKSRLMGLLREKGERKIMVHAVLVRVSDVGVLITGESGVGKTACGLELARRGGIWVADDAVVIERRGDCLYGRGHERTKRLIAVRGKGILPAEKLLSAGTLRKETRVDLVIRFMRDSEEGAIEAEMTRPVCQFLGISLPARNVTDAGDPRRMARRIVDAVTELLASQDRQVSRRLFMPAGEK